MTLPPEIRQEITKYVLSFVELKIFPLQSAQNEKSCNSSDDNSSSSQQSYPGQLELKFCALGCPPRISAMLTAVLRVCKALRVEALPYLYQQNIITFSAPSKLPLLYKYKKQNGLEDFRPWMSIRHIALSYDMIEDETPAGYAMDIRMSEGFNRFKYHSMALSDITTFPAIGFMRNLVRNLVKLQCFEILFGIGVVDEDIDDRIIDEPILLSLINEMTRFKQWYDAQKMALDNSDKRSESHDLIRKWSFSTDEMDHHDSDHEFPVGARSWHVTWSLDSVRTKKFLSSPNSYGAYLSDLVLYYDAD